jgi:hypothetical protein
VHQDAQHAISQASVRVVHLDFIKMAQPVSSAKPTSRAALFAQLQPHVFIASTATISQLSPPIANYAEIHFSAACIVTAPQSAQIANPAFTSTQPLIIAKPATKIWLDAKSAEPLMYVLIVRPAIT